MSDVVVRAAVVELKPSGPWQWQGWNGRVDVTTTTQRVCDVGGACLVLFDDVKNAVSTSVPSRSYTSPGFDQPGLVLTVQVLGTDSTFCDVLEILGAPALSARSRGTFRLSVSPAQNSAPSADPVIQKAGTWRIVDVAQSIFAAE